MAQQYETDGKSGEIFVVEYDRNGNAVGINGGLHYREVKASNLGLFDTEPVDDNDRAMIAGWQVVQPPYSGDEQ